MAELKSDHRVILNSLPLGLVSGLPEEDQLAVRSIVGQPVTLASYGFGQAELEFTDADGDSHSIWVEPNGTTYRPEVEPRQAALQLRDILRLQRSAGAVWAWKDGASVTLVVRLSPGNDEIANRVPTQFQGYPTRVLTGVGNVAAS